jgi:hypothetical protein
MEELSHDWLANMAGADGRRLHLGVRNGRLRIARLDPPWAELSRNGPCDVRSPANVGTDRSSGAEANRKTVRKGHALNLDTLSTRLIYASALMLALQVATLAATLISAMRKTTQPIKARLDPKE